MATKTHPQTPLDECRIIKLKSLSKDGIRSTVAENDTELPFAVKRVFYIYDIPAGAERGGHSHYAEKELIVAVAGRFDVAVTDGREWRRFTLSNADEALFMPPGLWRMLDRFAEGSIVLSMSPYEFDEADYVRDFDEFLRLRGAK